MSNEKAGCGRIPLVSEARLKIAALSSDPGNSFRGFWHCAEILTFSLLPSRAGGEESMCRDNKRAQLCLRLVGHTPGIVHLKFSKINQYSYQLWLLHLVGWHWELRCTHHTSISKSFFWSVEDCSQPSSSLKKMNVKLVCISNKSQIRQFSLCDSSSQGKLCPCLLILGLFSNSSKSSS